MSWSQVEQYHQLEQRYEAARADYEQAESHYQGAAESADPDDPALHAQYQALLEKKANLDALYAELTALRNSLAHATESSPRQAAL